MSKRDETAKRQAAGGDTRVSKSRAKSRRPKRPSSAPRSRANATDAFPATRRGRPPGSVSLTDEIAETIIAFIQAGAFAYVAAEAAGISARTFHDWMARGEDRHPTRRPTRKLRTFARNVRKAEAQARIVAETTVFREKPAYWLPRVARSRPGREGWTDPLRPSLAREGDPEPTGAIDYEDARDALARALAYGASGTTPAGDTPTPAEPTGNRPKRVKPDPHASGGSPSRRSSR